MREKTFRPLHALWLAVPLAAFWGSRSVTPGAPAPQEGVPATSSVRLQSADLAPLNEGLEKADASQLRARLLAAAALQTEARGDALQLICARWAELDPKGALAFIDGTPELRDPTLRVMLLKEWALNDLNAAWDYLAAHPGPEGDDDLQMVAQGLLIEDPALFVQWAWRAPQHIGQPEAENPAWLSAARAKPEELQAIAMKILEIVPASPNDPSNWNQSTATLFTLLGSARAEKDPRAVFEWADTLPDPYRAQALKGALVTLAKNSPAAALERFEALCQGKSSDWLDKTFHSYGDHDEVNGPSVLVALGKEDPMVVANLILKYPGLDSTSALKDVFGNAMATGKMNPLDAYRALRKADGDSGLINVNVLPRIWEGLSPEQLADTAATLSKEPDSDARGEAMGGLLESWYKTDPEAALKFGESLGDPDLRRAFYQRLVSGISGGISTTNLPLVPASDRAAVIAESLDQITQRNSLGPGYSSRGTRMEDLAPFLTDLPPSPELTAATTNLVAIWSQTDPRAALEWAGHLPNADARAARMADAVKGWSFHDSNGAAEWIDTQPSGSVRDAVTLPLVSQLKESEPGIAWDWANSISNETLRSQARREAFTAWAASDPEGASAALDSASGLSEADLLALRQTLPPP